MLYGFPQAIAFRSTWSTGSLCVILKILHLTWSVVRPLSKTDGLQIALNDVISVCNFENLTFFRIADLESTMWCPLEPCKILKILHPFWATSRYLTPKRIHSNWSSCVKLVCNFTQVFAFTHTTNFENYTNELFPLHAPQAKRWSQMFSPSEFLSV